MTKTIKTPAEVFASAATETVAVPNINEVEGADYWKRECALDKAIQFHKNNGGMMTAQQLVVNAYVFLTFLNGESK